MSTPAVPLTHHAWSTVADVPPGAWAAMLTDMNPLLGVLAANGATITGPDGAGPVIADGENLSMLVTAPGKSTVSIAMTRAAGSFATDTDDVLYDGLVAAALERARHWFGNLLTYDSGAGTTAHGIADGLGGRLFAAGDAALTGGAAADVNTQVGAILGAARARIDAAPPGTVTGYLQALIGELTAARDGHATADGLAGP